jgi:thioesterase domain-containing protein
MNKEEAQLYIEKNIPMSTKMGMQIIELSRKSVRIAMPFAPNINHQGSVFGGSIDSVFFVTCWAYVQLLIADCNPHPKIVGRSGNSVFHAPIKSDFETKLIIPDKKEANRFLMEFNHKGKAKLTTCAVINYEGKIAADFKGEFVVISNSNS